MLQSDPLDTITRIDLINDLFYVGRYEEALASARRLILLSPSAYAYRGELDSAFSWLDRAYRQHDAGMLSVRVDPLLENLRKDSRYKAILVRMKLDDDPSARGL
jgi:hypothetical protein